MKHKAESEESGQKVDSDVPAADEGNSLEQVPEEMKKEPTATAVPVARPMDDTECMSTGVVVSESSLDLTRSRACESEDENVWELREFHPHTALCPAMRRDYVPVSATQYSNQQLANAVLQHLPPGTRNPTATELRPILARYVARDLTGKCRRLVGQVCEVTFACSLS